MRGIHGAAHRRRTRCARALRSSRSARSTLTACAVLDRGVEQPHARCLHHERPNGIHLYDHARMRSSSAMLAPSEELNLLEPGALDRDFWRTDAVF